MGFSTGVTGGVTLTLSLAYLTLITHQRTRERQAENLRAQSRILNTLTSSPAAAAAIAASSHENDGLLFRHRDLPLTRAERDAQHRHDLFSSAKDRWNSEVEGAVRWASNTDWAAVREGAEAASIRLWRTAFPLDPEAAAKETEERARRLAARAEERARATARRAEQRVQEAEDDLRRRAEMEKARAEERAREVAAAAERARAGVKEEVGSMTARAVRKGKEVAGKAKSAVSGVVDEGKAAAGAVIGAKTSNDDLSPVQKALKQRFEGPDEVMSRSVKEILAERYLPVEQRDNTRLRWL